MNIVQVNNCDLVGRRFNGHDLNMSLNEIGHNACQFVFDKSGNEPTTISLYSKEFKSEKLYIRSLLKSLEYQLSMVNLLHPFGKAIVERPEFINADIVHYHLIHNHVISILDFPKLTNLKPSIWTVHDPWLVTGHCIYPRECLEWENGCLYCPRLKEEPFPMQIDKASQMYKIKEQAYKNIDIDIVVSARFMEDYIRKSPLTSHFKHIHKIPFGIDVNSFSNTDRKSSRNELKIDDSSFVIAFRAEANENKGLKYITEMLSKLTQFMPVTLLTVGTETLPLYITEKYNVIELGWQNDLNTLYNFYAACDVFLMPSLAETFGLMAIEAMASGCPIIVFEDTVLPEITYAPECGISVPYKNSNMLRVAVERLMQNPDECKWRGEKGKEIAKMYYQYKDYVNKHIALYEDVLNRKGKAR